MERMSDVEQRTFRLPDGRTVRVTIAPRELRDGVGLDPELRTLVFEVVNGEWIGNVPIVATRALSNLTEEELRRYFHRARGPEGRIS
jgi:hypothetical protein